MKEKSEQTIELQGLSRKRPGNITGGHAPTT